MFAVLALSNAFSERVRCICTLCVPTLGSQAGRIFLLSVLVALLVAGPVDSIGRNASETVRVTACTAATVVRIRKAHLDLLLMPVREVVRGLRGKAQTFKVGCNRFSLCNFSPTRQALGRSMWKTFGPIMREVRGGGGAKETLRDRLASFGGEKLKAVQQIREKYLAAATDDEEARIVKEFEEKTALKCEDVLSLSTEGCRELFASAYDTCSKTVTVALSWLLCWPFKLSVVCKPIVRKCGVFVHCSLFRQVENVFFSDLTGGTMCKPEEAVSPSFGASYLQAEKTVRSFTQDFHVHFSYGSLKAHLVSGVKKAKTIRDEMLEAYRFE